MDINWHKIQNASIFESLTHALLDAEDPKTRLFLRPGKDSGMDAISGDKKCVYQAKFHDHSSMSKAIADAKSELKKIKEYRKKKHKNFKYWKHVSNWVLIGNFKKNISDHARWETEIMPLFQEEGIHASYWDIETLQGKLISAPHVKTAFFDDINRSLLGYKESILFLSSTTAFFEPYSKLFGRSVELKIIERFLRSSKQAIPILGDKGVGKTKFIFESLKIASNIGWRILWGVPEQMQNSNQWFKGINLNVKTCIALDDINDYALLKSVLAQISITNASGNIKLIFSSNDLSTIKQHPNAEKCFFDAITLENLDEPDSLDLLADLEITNKVLAYQIYSNANLGNPLWMLLLVNACISNALNVPDKVDTLLQLYIENRIHGIQHAKTILRWFALWGNVDLSESNQASKINFFENKKISQDDFFDALTRLKARGVLKSYGIGSRLWSVKDKIEREYILSDWILEKNHSAEYKASNAGKNLIKQIKDGSIVATDEIFKSLMNLAFNRLNESNRKSFFEPLFQELVKMSKSKKLQTQRDALATLKLIAPVNIERSMDVLTILAENENSDKIISGHDCYKHEYRFASLIEDAYSALPEFIPYVKTENDASIILSYIQEISTKYLFDTKHVIKQIFKSENATLFAPQSIEFVKNDLGVGNISVFSKNLLSGLLNLAFASAEMIGTHTITIGHKAINPRSKRWQYLHDVLKLLFSCLNSGKENLNISVWQIVRNFIEEFNYLQMFDSPTDILFSELLKNTLESILRTLENRIRLNTISFKELCAARHIWERYLDQEYARGYQKLYIAKACEALYISRSTYAVEKLCEYPKEFDNEENIKDIMEKFNKDPNLEKLFGQLNDFISTSNNSASINYYAQNCFVGFFTDSFNVGSDKGLLNFVKATLRENHNTNPCAWDFSIDLLGRHIVQLHANNSANKAFIKVKSFVSKAASKARLILDVYKFLEKLSAQELNLIFEYRNLFTKKEYTTLLLRFIRFNWEDINKELENLIKENPESSNDMFHILSERLFFSYETLPETLLKKIINDVLDWAQKYNLCTEFMENHHWSYVFDKNKNIKLSITRITSFFCSRFSLLHRKEKCLRFSIFPCSKTFQIQSWCNFDPNNDNDKKAFLNFCEIIFNQTPSTIFGLYQHLCDLDSDGSLIEIFISKKLSHEKSLKTLSVCARLISGYAPESVRWAEGKDPQESARERLQSILFQASKNLKKSDLEVIYRLTMNNSTGVYSGGGPNKAASFFYEQVERAKMKYDSQPNDSPLKAFYLYWVEKAQIDLKHQEERMQEYAGFL